MAGAVTHQLLVLLLTMSMLALTMLLVLLQLRAKYIDCQTSRLTLSKPHLHSSMTATLEYEHLNTINLPVRLRVISGLPNSKKLASLMLLLCGDIHLNPGPSQFKIFSFNIRSLLNPLHISSLHEIIAVKHPDIVALSETSTSTPAQLKESVCPGYTLINQPRLIHNRKSAHKSSCNLGGGLAFLVREQFHMFLVREQFPFFQLLIF